MKALLTVALVSALAAGSAQAGAEVVTLTIENHAFSPKELRIAAGQKVDLKVVNKDATPAEFESKPLAREKIIAGKSSAIIKIGPLKPGRYPFVEEYHENDAAAQGVIVVE